MTNESTRATTAPDLTAAHATIYREAIAQVCEGWTLPASARKVLETALWAGPVQPSPSTGGEPATDSTGRNDIGWKMANWLFGMSASELIPDSWRATCAKLSADWHAAREPAPVARDLDADAERRAFDERMGPQGDDPLPEWYYRLHAAAEALSDEGCASNAADVRDIANSLVDLIAARATAESAPASAAPFDKGPWRHIQEKDTATTYKDIVESYDFTHDVRLYVNGDFASLEQRAEYCKGLAKALNAGAADNSKESKQ